MDKTERLMTKEVEEDCVNIILQQVIKNNMTISNIKKVTDKVINYLESNAILEMKDTEDLDNAKSSIHN